jgi:formylmethanofuran dehydrogenase subunit D
MQPPWMAAITGMRKVSNRVNVDCKPPSMSKIAARPSALWSSMLTEPPKASSDMPALKCLPVLLMTNTRARFEV